MSFVYAVQLWPEEMPHHIKIGFSINHRRRLRAFKTAAPHARFIGVWATRSGPHDEVRIHEYFELQCVGGEVFEVDPKEVIEVIEQEFCLDPISL